MYSVKKIVLNENFNQLNLLNDIALLILNDTVEINQHIQMTCLPDYFTTYFPKDYGIDSYIAGWGDLIGNSNFISNLYCKNKPKHKKFNLFKETFPNILQNVKITLYDLESCNYLFPTVEKSYKSQICAGKILFLLFNKISII